MCKIQGVILRHSETRRGGGLLFNRLLGVCAKEWLISRRAVPGVSADREKYFFPTLFHDSPVAARQVGRRVFNM